MSSTRLQKTSDRTMFTSKILTDIRIVDGLSAGVLVL
jgi:hypothetical protein